MPAHASTHRRRAPVAAFPLAATAIYAAAVAIARTQPLDAKHGVVAYALMADLLLVVPGLWFWLVVRGRGVRVRTLVPVLALSALGAALVLPPPYRGELRVLVLPIEVAATSLLAWVAWKIIRARAGAAPADPGTLPEQIAAVARSAFGFDRLAEFLAYEVGFLVYAIAGWRMRPRAGARTFTVHRRSDWHVVALGLGVVLAAEAFPVHVAVSGISPPAAWIVSGLSVYSLLWLIGDYQALRLRPCRLEDEALLVRVGLRWKAHVPLAIISDVRPARGTAPPRRDRDYLRATVLGDATVVVVLREPVQAIGPYGFRRNVRRIGLAPDEEGAFLAALDEARS